LLTEQTKEYNNRELEKVIALISSTTERSIQLIRDFVQQEFLASANSLSKKNRVNIVEKVQEALEQYDSSEKNIDKDFNFSVSHHEIFMEVDDYKFMQVINN